MMKNSDSKNQNYVGLGVFSGAGGLDFGLMLAGIDISLAIDFDQKACETYKLNHPHTTVWNRDISTITGKEIRQVIGDRPVIVVGGPPCQSWSDFQNEIEGSQKGIDDKRGQMIYQYLRIAEELQPIAVVFENVPHMVTNINHLKEFEKFKSKLAEKTGLRLDYQVLNAIDYGDAQLRERVIMIGTKPNVPNPFQFLQKKKGHQTLREALRDVPKSEYFHFKKTDKEVMKMIREGQCWKALPTDIAFSHMQSKYRGICLDCNNNFIGFKQCPNCKSYRIKNGYGVTSYLRRLSWDKPSPTICAVPTNKTHGLLAHPSEERCLSIRECARLQGFPDDYQFVGNIFEQQRQIGNAVSVSKAKAIGSALLQALSSVQQQQPEQPSSYDVNIEAIKYIVNNPNRFFLSELEKDFIRIAYKRYKDKLEFPQKYSVYFKEIILKLSSFKTKNNAI